MEVITTPKPYVPKKTERDHTEKALSLSLEKLKKLRKIKEFANSQFLETEEKQHAILAKYYALLINGDREP